MREAKVIVTFLNGAKSGQDAPPARPHRQIQFGKYSGDGVTNEEDFKLAEFHGDPDDGLDWTGV